MTVYGSLVGGSRSLYAKEDKQSPPEHTETKVNTTDVVGLLTLIKEKNRLIAYLNDELWYYKSKVELLTRDD